MTNAQAIAEARKVRDNEREIYKMRERGGFKSVEDMCDAHNQLMRAETLFEDMREFLSTGSLS